MDRGSPEWKAFKRAYDKARYVEVRAKKIETAGKWYRENKAQKQAYDKAYRPVKNDRRRDKYHSDDTYHTEVSEHNMERRRRRALNNYGLTQTDYDLMVEAQGDCCACCGSSDPCTANNCKTWCVDHDHVTGAVRGLLCVKCNTGIGVLGDTPQGVANAVNYLNKHYGVTEAVDEHY